MTKLQAFLLRMAILMLIVTPFYFFMKSHFPVVHELISLVSNLYVGYCALRWMYFSYEWSRKGRDE